MANFKVHGISQTDYQKLKSLAAERLGKDSVSLLAKQLLLSLLAEGDAKEVPKAESKHRLEVKLGAHDSQYLFTASRQHGLSPNMMLVSILRGYITKHPNLSVKEIEVLYQSNGQLLRIGRNINQIARQLNAMEGVNLTSDHIAKLHTFIDEHTKRVGDVLLANRRRFG
ncbi:MAG: plasmid mobilization relaxosome protein MobC [Neisseriaceae bacterium]|nr:plasmid mobilization relaxosome protein MobC [Neisseriaceae bacterium]